MPRVPGALAGRGRGDCQLSLLQSRLERHPVRPAHLPVNRKASSGGRRLAGTRNTRVTFNILLLQLNCKTILSVNTCVKNNDVVTVERKPNFISLTAFLIDAYALLFYLKIKNF